MKIATAHFINHADKSINFIGEHPGTFVFGKDVTLNNAIIDITGGVEIGDRVHFGLEVMVFSCSHPVDLLDGNDRKHGLVCKKVKIGNDICVGSRVMILEGVTIGDGAYIAAGAVVTKDVEPRTLVGGVPAQFIRNI